MAHHRFSKIITLISQIALLTNPGLGFRLRPISSHTFTSRTNVRLMMTTPTKDPTPERVLIAGSGIIGLSTAYHLAKTHSIPTTLIDPTGEIAPAASSKAGGFLALDWNDYSPIGPLTRRSFDLHQEFANEVGVDTIQYRRLTCASISVGEGMMKKPSGKKLVGVEWADNENDGDSSSVVTGSKPLGNENTIAQVHPRLLCDALWSETCKLLPECKLVKGQVVSPECDDSDGDYDTSKPKRLIGARLNDGTVVQGDALLYACGPWTKVAPMYGVKYHSAVVPTKKVLSQAVFFDGFGDPEVYPRPDRTAYLTGFPEPPVVVTEEPGNVHVSMYSIDKIVNSVRQASGFDGDDDDAMIGKEATLKQSCYLPTTPDSLPVMGRIFPSVSGVAEGVVGNCYVAAGHSCWGILMGHVTGESMATLIATGSDKTDYVDLRSFNPSRFIRR